MQTRGSLLDLRLGKPQAAWQPFTRPRRGSGYASLFRAIYRAVVHHCQFVFWGFLLWCRPVLTAADFLCRLMCKVCEDRWPKIT